MIYITAGLLGISVVIFLIGVVCLIGSQFLKGVDRQVTCRAAATAIGLSVVLLLVCLAVNATVAVYWLFPPGMWL